MRLALAALVLPLLAGSAAAVDADTPTTTGTTPGGRLEVAEPVFDAGKVDRGQTLRHDFVLKNAGTEPLGVDAKPG